MEVRTLLLDQPEFEGVTRLGMLRPRPWFENPQLGQRRLSLLAAAQGLFLDRGECVFAMVGEIRGSVGLVAAVAPVGGFFDPELGTDLILQAEFPGPGAGGVILPEAAVGDAERRVGLALRVHSRRPVTHREMRPVVVLLTLGRGEFLPPLLGFLPLREQRAARGRRC